MIILAIVALVVLAVPLIDFVFRADLRRVALRNLVRRPAEAGLVVFGSLLATAIIAAAFIVGDSFDKSIRDIARTELGPIDELVILSDLDDLPQAVSLLSDPIDGTDGILPVVTIDGALATSDTNDRRAEPNSRITEIDFDDARAFGAHPGITGLQDAGPTPVGDEVLISQTVADELRVSAGDQIVLFAYNQEVPLTVRGVLPKVGLGGTNSAYVAPGSLEALAATASGDLARAPDGLIYVSNEGAVFDSVAGSNRIEGEIEERLNGAGIDFQSSTWKQELLNDAEAEGAEMTELFTVIGGFSVAAGVLLLINLFIMLAEERKTTLGVLRAVGWRRSTLVRSFALEGAAYAVIASVLGALLGIGVGWVIIQVTQRIIGADDLTMLLAVEPNSLITAGLAGLAISLVAIWGASLRISRLNIIRAIRDLPAPATKQSRLWKRIAGIVLVLIGIWLFLMPGLGGESVIAALVGPALAFFGAALALAQWVSADRRALGGGLAIVIWGSLCMVVLPSSMTNDIDLPFFLVLGLVLVAGGVAVATTAGPMLRRLLDFSTEPRVAARVGMAYPLAQKIRTAISLASFTLVIFSMVFISVISRGFSNQVADFTDEADLGHDIVVFTNASSPVDAASLEAVDGVDAVSPLVRSFARFSSDYNPESQEDPDFWGVTGANTDVSRFGHPVLESRSPEYATDKEAYEAVAGDTSLAIVPDWFLANDDGDTEPRAGATIQMLTPSGTTHDFTVVGVVSLDAIDAGAWVSEEFMREELAEFSAQSRYLITTDEGVSARSVAEDLNGLFVYNGLDAETVRDRIQGSVDTDTAFFSLLNGYLAIGLVIGIAGLGVILVRAIRERRRQIGMLRAMGMPRSGIRSTFMTEGVFVTLLAIVTGVLLGLVVANLVLTQSEAVGDNTGGALPWSSVAMLSGLTLIAALIVASVPAIRAARLHPSEALRLAD